jgi:hypothetical protein
VGFVALLQQSASVPILRDPLTQACVFGGTFPPRTRLAGLTGLFHDRAMRG